MTTLNNDIINEIRENIRTEIGRILRVNKYISDIVVSSFDGMPIASSSNSDLEFMLAAVSAALKGIAEKVSATLNSGGMLKLLLEYEKEKIAVLSVNSMMNILIRAAKDAPLGLIIHDVVVLADKIKNKLSVKGVIL